MNKELKRKVDKWVSENYLWLDGQISKNIAYGQMAQYASDLTIYLIESIYTLPVDKVEQMLEDDKLGGYLLVGAGMQLRSSHSPFYRTFRKFKMSAREDGIEGTLASIFDKPDIPYDDSLYECFQEAYGKLHWYQKALMDKYFYENWTLQELYEFYNISKRHIIKDINTGIKQIREHCKHC